MVYLPLLVALGGWASAVVSDIQVTSEVVILSLENDQDSQVTINIDGTPLEPIEAKVDNKALYHHADLLWKSAEYLAALISALDRTKRSGGPLNLIFQYVERIEGNDDGGIRDDYDDDQPPLEIWSEPDESNTWDIKSRLRKKKDDFCRDRLFWINLRPSKPTSHCDGDDRCDGLAEEVFISRELQFGIIHFLESAFHDHHRPRLYKLLHDLVCHPRVRRIGLDEAVSRASPEYTVVLPKEPSEAILVTDSQEESGGVAAAASPNSPSLDPSDDGHSMETPMSEDPKAITSSCVPAMNDFTPNDAKILQQWHWSTIGAKSAWSLVRNVAVNSPIALVIDSGIWTQHPDLAANLWVNQAELYGRPGVDDDNNGFVDDIHGVAYSGGKVSGDVTDEDGHGTFCAGEIAAVSNNGIGVAGLGTRTRVAACKFFGKGGGLLSDAFRCMSYGVTIGASVISASWGGASMTTYWNGILENLANRGINLIIASGNGSTNLDVSPNFPACYKSNSTLTTLAFKENLNLINYGNYGASCVDLAAPGDYVFSTDVPANGNYTYRGGTSMAAPLVAGTIALLLEVNPNLTPVQRVNMITSNLIIDPRYKGLMKFPGRLNVKDAVSSAFCARTSSSTSPINIKLRLEPYQKLRMPLLINREPHEATASFKMKLQIVQETLATEELEILVPPH